jgi:hypothetical protein
VLLSPLFQALLKKRLQGMHTTAIGRHMGSQAHHGAMNGIRRIQLCRSALDALDRRGWDRSFHQRLFHEEYLKSCARIFFKRDGPGSFARNHNRVLELNGWDSTPQEILVSTPRRFGKTISVSMFAAAMVFSAPNMELSIYSTCKRISQKLLRTIVKFLELIYIELGVPPYKVLRMNSEVHTRIFLQPRAHDKKNEQEVHIAGPEGQGDVRVVNSYPSKIGWCPECPLEFAHREACYDYQAATTTRFAVRIPPCRVPAQWRLYFRCIRQVRPRIK